MRRKSPTYRSLSLPQLICGMPRPVFLAVGILGYLAVLFVHGLVLVAVLALLFVVGRLAAKWNFTSISVAVDGIFSPPVYDAAQYTKGGRKK